MPITVVCKCGKTLLAKDEHAGLEALCPSCGKTLKVPVPLTNVVSGEPPGGVTEGASPASSFRCTVCSGYFAAQDVYDDNGRIICDGCFEKQRSATPNYPAANWQQPTYQPGWQQPTYGPAYGRQPAGYSRFASLPTYLAPAILCTIFCCQPFGIVAIVFAAQVNGKLRSGDYYGATASSDSARKWCWASFISGLIIIIVWVIIVAAGGRHDSRPSYYYR